MSWFHEKPIGTLALNNIKGSVMISDSGVILYAGRGCL